MDQWLTFLVNDLERASGSCFFFNFLIILFLSLCYIFSLPVGVNAKIPLLFVLNSMLQPLVFVVSGKLTFVDVFFYTALHPLLVCKDYSVLSDSVASIGGSDSGRTSALRQRASLLRLHSVPALFDGSRGTPGDAPSSPRPQLRQLNHVGCGLHSVV